MPSDEATDLTARHRLILIILWLSLPPVAAIGLYMGEDPSSIGLVTLALIAVAIAAAATRPMWLAPLVTSIGLVGGAGAIVVFNDATTVSQLGFVVALVVISLYRLAWPLLAGLIGIGTFYLVVTPEGSLVPLTLIATTAGLLLIGQRVEATTGAAREAAYKINFDYSPIGMALLRPTGELIEFNTALTNMLVVDAADLRGKNIETIVHSDDLAELGDAWEQIGNHDSHMATAWLHIVGSAGEAIWGKMTLTLEAYQKGRPALVVMQLEPANRWRNEREQLEQTVRDRESYIAAIAGEVSESLESVVNKGNTLDLPHADSRRVALDMRSELARVAAIVSDLRFSSDSRVETRLVPHNVDVLKMCVALIAESGAEIPIEASAKDAWADPRPTRQIIRALLDNALTYGGPTVEVRIRHSGPDTVVQVVDDGPEIPERDRERIFNGDFLSGPPVTRPASVGQRLTVARRLAERMDGEVTYQRASDDRNVYELRLPTESISVSFDMTEVALTSSG